MRTPVLFKLAPLPYAKLELFCQLPFLSASMTKKPPPAGPVAPVAPGTVEGAPGDPVAPVAPSTPAPVAPWGP